VSIDFHQRHRRVAGDGFSAADCALLFGGFRGNVDKPRGDVEHFCDGGSDCGYVGRELRLLCYQVGSREHDGKSQGGASRNGPTAVLNSLARFDAS